MILYTEHKIRVRSRTAGILSICIPLSLAALLLCTAAGSVSIPVGDTVRVLLRLLTGQAVPAGTASAIIAGIRLPRVLNVFLSGMCLSLSGAAMQGLLKNPLADGSTLGVSSGAGLGAVLALSFGIGSSGGLGVTGLAMLTALGSIALILLISRGLDRSLTTHTVILTGVVFSMLINALISLIVTFSGEKAKNYLFWTMGSLSGTTYRDALIQLLALLLFGGYLLSSCRELDAFAMGEANARSIGVDVTGCRRRILIAVSCLTGVSVSIGR